MMIPGTKYEFRVVAENRAGKSQPSETTLPQVVSFIMIIAIMMMMMMISIIVRSTGHIHPKVQIPQARMK